MEPIRCRIAACSESLGDGGLWSFYLINDSDTPLDAVTLYKIEYEFGDMGNSEATDKRVTGVAPGAHALLWRDDGSGVELRMELFLRVQARDREMRMQFEFPRLYKLKDLPVVDGLGKPGYQVAAAVS